MIRSSNKTKRLRVFLSYSEPDRIHAHRLRNLLLSSNVQVSTPDAFSSGRDWPGAITDQIAKCDVLMVVLSLDSLDSEPVLLGLGAAWALKVPVIGIATQPEINAIPDALGPATIIPLDEIEKPGTLKMLIGRFEGLSATARKRKASKQAPRPKEAV